MVWCVQAGVELMALVEDSTNQDEARVVCRSRNVKACFTISGIKLTLRGQSEVRVWSVCQCWVLGGTSTC